MNYYEHHLGDYAKDTAHLSMLEHGAYRMLLDRYYGTEQGIPADQAHRITRARTREEKSAVDVVLEEFFFLVDGVWKNKRADAEIEKFSLKKPKIEEKKENDKQRQQRARERRKALFQQLSENNIHMPWNSTTEQLQAEIDRVTSQRSHAPVTQPVTRDNTATQTPDTRHQTPVNSTHKEGIHTLTVVGEQKSASTQLAEPSTREGLLCRHLRKIGIDAAPHLMQKPEWQELLAKRSDEEIIAVAEIKKRSKPNERITLNYLYPAIASEQSPPQVTRKKSTSKQDLRADYFAQQGYGNATIDNDESQHNTIDGQSQRIDC